MNYAKEEIPNREKIVAKANYYIDQLTNYDLYAFKDLFEEKEIQYKKEPINRTEYHRNTAKWGKGLLSYNNWSTNDYEESLKSGYDQSSKNEVKGIYVFYKNDKPVYVGISRKLINRLKNHFLGTTHNQCSLVYLILRKEYEDKMGNEFDKKREDLPDFNENRKLKQVKMKANWRIRIIPIEDNYELYLTEFLLACELKTKWNSFETH